MERVLITGCSSGIGRATAHAFRDVGWRVFATARDPEDIADLADAGCRTDTLDVTERGDVGRVIGRLADDGGIDCLVNNAGYGQFGACEDVPTDRVHAQFDVNVYGPHRLIRAALPELRDTGGTIVNVSSVAGRVAFPGGGVYCASKWALEGLSDALRGEVEPHGVDVVLVEPGPVRTSFTERAADESSGLERSDVYADLYGTLDDASVVGGSGLGAVPPERVARTIRSAATRADPPARMPVGLIARFGILARHLPDGVRDAALRLAFRVGS